MPITATNAVITASSGRKPYRCSPRMRNVITPVMTRRREERDAEQQLDPERGAEELGQVGRHRDQLRLDPETDRGPAGEALPADLREVPAGRDPELRRQRLDQHRHQVRGDDHPEEREAELRAARDVRREVARVHVGHAGDEGRARGRGGAASATRPGGRVRLPRAGAGRSSARVDIIPPRSLALPNFLRRRTCRSGRFR